MPAGGLLCIAIIVEKGKKKGMRGFPYFAFIFKGDL